jgi:hypothetical protein
MVLKDEGYEIHCYEESLGRGRPGEEDMVSPRRMVPYQCSIYSGHCAQKYSILQKEGTINS